MSKWISLEQGANGMFAEIPLGSSAGGARVMGKRPVRAGISLIGAGDMSPWRQDSASRRKALLHGIGWPEERVFAVHQAHTMKVERVSGRSPSDLARATADGLIGEYGEHLLTVTAADCLPIFIVDPATGAFGIVHSGWKGTGIVREAIRLMRVELGVITERLAVSIGPGIGPCCYEVPRERFEEFRSRFGEKAVARGDGEGHRLDLRGANIALLEEVGVEDITVVSDCTACGRGFGSFRREGPAAFTRMAAFIGPFAA